MIGFETDTNHLAFKRSTGEMEVFPSEMADASYQNVQIRNISNGYSQRISIDGTGQVLAGDANIPTEMINFVRGFPTSANYPEDDFPNDPVQHEGRLFYHDTENTLQLIDNNPFYKNFRIVYFKRTV